jgi:thiol-disulfide isomerase/thioredoxin
MACQSTPRPAAKPQQAAKTSASPGAPVAQGPAWVGVRVEEHSARITQVIRGAPAERAGLRIGDQIKAVNGTPIGSGPEFVQRVMAAKAGDRLAIEIVRGGGTIKFEVVADARPQSLAKSSLIGKPAPAFVAAQLAGPFSTTLADHRGHVVIVDFWATWCGPCAITIPRLNDLHAKYADRGLRIIGLSSEEPELIKKFVADGGLSYAIGHDTRDKISSEYLREGIPMFVVIDKQGIVRQVVVGSDMDAVEAAIPALL